MNIRSELDIDDIIEERIGTLSDEDFDRDDADQN